MSVSMKMNCQGGRLASCTCTLYGFLKSR